MSEWQSIETAPRDGSVVDLWSRLHRDRWTDCAWEDGRWWVGSNSYEEYEFEPTHWMPLPDPPSVT